MRRYLLPELRSRARSLRGADARIGMLSSAPRSRRGHVVPAVPDGNIGRAGCPAIENPSQPGARPGRSWVLTVQAGVL
jgi:hypothetical protein